MSVSFLSFQSEFVSKVGDSGGGMYTVSILEILRMWNNTVTDKEMFTHISVILFFSIESGVVTLKYAFMAKNINRNCLAAILLYSPFPGLRLVCGNDHKCTTFKNLKIFSK